MSASWSHSSLSLFEQCPRRYYFTRVSKEVTEPQTEVLRWGNEVHKALELRLKGQAALPKHLEHHEPLVASLLSKKGRRVVEQRVCVDQSFKPVEYFSKQAWCRGVLDVGLIGTSSAFVGDWKTGKRRPDSDQLQLFAAMTFAHYPHLEQVNTAFIWLQESSMDATLFTREQVPGIWESFCGRVARLNRAFEEKQWLPKPSGLCGKYCPVSKRHCEFGK